MQPVLRSWRKKSWDGGSGRGEEGRRGEWGRGEAREDRSFPFLWETLGEPTLRTEARSSTHQNEALDVEAERLVAKVDANRLVRCSQADGRVQLALQITESVACAQFSTVSASGKGRQRLIEPDERQRTDELPILREERPPSASLSSSLLRSCTSQPAPLLVRHRRTCASPVDAAADHVAGREGRSEGFAGPLRAEGAAVVGVIAIPVDGREGERARFGGGS